jgi:hypothetical protein
MMMFNLNFIELIYFLSSFWMAILILFVQWVHYPLFTYVSESQLIQFSEDHQRRISYLVGPAMILEWLSLVYLVIVIANPFFYIHAVLLGLIWLSTLLIQVPIHNQLLKSPSASLAIRLVHGNWIRTLLWCLKAILMGWYYF